MSEGGSPSRAYLVKLRNNLVKHCTDTDLQVFCFDLGVDYETVVASKSAKPLAVMALINYLNSRGRLGELVERARQEFPGVDWTDDAAPGAPTPVPETTSGDTETPIVTKAVSDVSTHIAREPVPKPPRAPGPLRAFLCHSSGDKVAVRQLYCRLQEEGVQPWLDEEDILPGKNWEREIQKAVRNSDLILVCLSKGSITKEGYLHEEIP